MNDLPKRSAEEPQKRVVGYSIEHYLDLTANWIYQQLFALRRYHGIVLCNTTANRNLFPWSDVYSSRDAGVLGYYAERVKRRVLRGGISRYHLAAARRHGISLLHSHFGPRAFYDIDLCQRLDIPLISSFYGVDATAVPAQHPRWRQNYRKLFECSSQVVVEAPNMKRVLTELGCESDKIAVNHLGVDLSTVEFKLRRREGPVKFFIASSFREKKGIPDALEAIGLLKPKLPAFTVTIAGAVAKSPESVREHEKMHAVIGKYGLTENVRFVGFLSRAALLTEGVANDIFISTSKTASNGDTEGGTNIAVIEMAATGMPIVTTRHCDLPTTMGDLNQRWLADEGSVESIARAIEGIVEDDWAALGASNRAHVEAKFDISRCVSSLETIYDNVEKRHQSAAGK